MKNRKYAIYSRKSKFTGKGESTLNQIEKCKEELVRKYDNSILDDIVIYQDEGFTGYNTNRPEFKKLINDIENRLISVVIVYKLDRISRNVSDFCNLKNKFEKYDVDFISVTERFDTSTPLGNAMLIISSVFAQLERDTIAERVKDNMYELSKTGRWLGGTTPLGYRSLKIDYFINGKNKYLYKLELIDNECDIVKLIFDKMILFKSIAKLEKYLKNNNIKTRKDKYFSKFAIRNILINPVYVIADLKIVDFFKDMGTNIYIDNSLLNNKYGLIGFNKTLEIPGKSKKYKDVKEWILSIGLHEGIISSDVFIEVWNLLHKK